MLMKDIGVPAWLYDGFTSLSVKRFALIIFHVFILFSLQALFLSVYLYMTLYLNHF